MQQPAQYRDIFLRPGRWYFGDAPTRMRTLLGPCVAITMWHPRRRLGGMCHFLLPTRGTTRFAPQDGYYGDEALSLLLKEVIRHNTETKEYHIGLFGGGNMFPDCLKTNTNQIGLRNVLLAQGLLTSLGLELTTQHIGGAGYRAIVFDVWSGEVRVRYQCLNSGETTETKKATQ